MDRVALSVHGHRKAIVENPQRGEVINCFIEEIVLLCY